VSNDHGKTTGGQFVLWWLGGFTSTGAIAAGASAAILVNGGVLAALGIALIGGIWALESGPASQMWSY